MIVDSHCHVACSWYEDVETLLFQMDRNEVDPRVRPTQHRLLPTSYCSPRHVV